MSVVAYRDGGEAALEADVDLGSYGNRLADVLSLDEAARGLLESLPAGAELAEARADRSGKQARYYLFRFLGASGSERMVKLSVQQSRLYTLHLQINSPSPALQAELLAIADSYQAFPISSMRGGLLRAGAAALTRHGESQRRRVFGWGSVLLSSRVRIWLWQAAQRLPCYGRRPH